MFKTRPLQRRVHAIADTGCGSLRFDCVTRARKIPARVAPVFCCRAWAAVACARMSRCTKQMTTRMRRTQCAAQLRLRWPSTARRRCATRHTSRNRNIPTPGALLRRDRGLRALHSRECDFRDWRGAIRRTAPRSCVAWRARTRCLRVTDTRPAARRPSPRPLAQAASAGRIGSVECLARGVRHVSPRHPGAV